MEYFMENYENIDFTTDTFKTQLKEALQRNEVGITFTKRDGSERTMQCTLSTSRIPGEQLPKGGDTSTSSTQAQAVFDIQKQGWRSFRWDSIKSVTFPSKF